MSNDELCRLKRRLDRVEGHLGDTHIVVCQCRHREGFALKQPGEAVLWAYDPVAKKTVEILQVRDK